MLTFNLGWDQNAQDLVSFTDVQALKFHFITACVTFAEDDKTLNTTSDSGPASFVVVDPDGNPILIERHR